MIIPMNPKNILKQNNSQTQIFESHTRPLTKKCLNDLASKTREIMVNKISSLDPNKAKTEYVKIKNSHLLLLVPFG